MTNYSIGGRLRALSLGGLLLCIATGMLLPVYTDEFGWRFQQRAAVDGFDVTYNDICGPNTVARAPWFMMPVRWFSATMNQALADPFYIRLTGVLCALTWLGLLLILSRRLEPDQSKRHLHQALAFSLLGLGVFPFQLILSRPEQPILLTTTLVVLIALINPSGIGTRSLAWLKSGLTVILCVVALSYHMKGVFVSVIAVMAFAVGGKEREGVFPRLLGAAITAALSVVSSMYWVTRFQCLTDRVSSESVSNENIVVALANGGFDLGMLRAAAMGFFPQRYVFLAKLEGSPESAWIPPGMFSPLTEAFSGGVLLFFWTLAIGFAVLQLGAMAVRDRLLILSQPKATLALAIIGCTCIWGISQIGRHFYEAAFVLPMMVLFILICMSLRERFAPSPSLFQVFVIFAVVSAFLSQTMLLSATYPALLKAAQRPGYPPNQDYSVSVVAYPKVSADISRAMASKGMLGGVRLERLMVDDLTYLALQQTRLPLYDIGVVGGWPRGIEDPVKYLLSRDSDGVVVGCAKLPRYMEVVAARSGIVCALSRADLVKLAEEAES